MQGQVSVSTMHPNMKLQKQYSTHFTGQWEWLPTVNEAEGPSPRCGHTLTVHGKQLDHANFIQNQMASNEKTESGRKDLQHHLGNTYGKLLVSFGESSLLASREYLDDMYLLDLASMKWVKILGKNILDEYKPYMKTNFNPVARADHASAAFGSNADRCLIFGGKCKDTYLDDLIVVKNICNFPVNRGEQKIYEAYHQKKQPQSSKKLFTDTPLKIESIHLAKGPCGRRGASLTPWKEGSFLLFGGQRGSLFFNDLWGLDLYKQGWVELATRRNPMERAFHSAFVDSQQQMLLLGGVRDMQAIPAPADIFKLDLRAGKFFKLGDKDMVPGIASALCKGHHSSHFLPKNCDLIIYSPQKASTHLLGGNVQSEHCGRCTEVHTFTHTQHEQHSEGSPQEQQRDINYPQGSCRPATALLESHRSTKELKSIGCNNRTLERLFVLGGYSPSTRSCTNQLYSLKFSAEACKIQNHQCKFTQTAVVPKALKLRQKYMSKTQKAQTDEEYNNTDNEDNRLSNITPMRPSAQSRKLQNITNSNQNEPTPSTSSQRQQQASSQQQTEQSSLLQITFPSSSKASCKSKMKSTTKRARSKGVTIVQTPVRAKAIAPSYLNAFRMVESSAATQKITALDPELTLQDTKIKPIAALAAQPEISGDLDAHKQLIHWQFIEKLLLNFDETLLDPDTSFCLEPHEVLEIIYTALPLLEKDTTLMRIEGPVKIFGDIHGQLGDLMSLFKSYGFPDVNVGDIGYYKYVFLGDFVDRGHKSLEVICLLLSLKIEYPDRVFLIRGNHECHAMNEMYGFYHEISERLYPNVNTLKYLDEDNNTLNENVPPELEAELNEYIAKMEAKEEERQRKHHEMFQQARNQPVLLEEMMAHSNDALFDFETEYEMVEVHIDDDDSYSSDEISCELNFDDDGGPVRKKLLKRYKSRRFFRDRNDCITYLVQSFELTFRWLPLAILVSNKILCVHGGIGQVETMEEIEQIQRPCDVVCDVQNSMDSNQKKVVDLLWSDPAENDTDTGFKANKRGVSCVFGSDVVRTFCKVNNIDLIVRGHQVVKDGFEYFAGGHLITLFSATNYCNVMDNAGAILCIDEKLRVIPKLVEARPINENIYNNHILSNGDEADDQQNEDTFNEQDSNENGQEDDNADKLQWRQLNQFPPSPMRNSGDVSIDSEVQEEPAVDIGKQEITLHFSRNDNAFFNAFSSS